MANSKTVLFPIEISYKAADDTVEVHNFRLTLSLSLEGLAFEGSTCGEVTINGAVMPVDDHPPGVQEGDGEATFEAGDSMQKAA
jgi:hypothetical protein